jgi:TRAP-type C4-dicarboxylate transport system permease large subunit
MARMTVAQKVIVTTGASGPSYARFLAIGSVRIPAMNLEDGPAASATDG